MCSDNVDRLKKVVANADGFMGLVTFTIEWHASVDLDLWFFCK